MHAVGVLHRDLKPNNLLMNSDCDLKICDFGLSRALLNPKVTTQADDQAVKMTDYVVTRNYRAPEVIISQKQYGAEVDVWSVGCIFAELIRGKMLFPAENEKDLLIMITELCGAFPPHMLDLCQDESCHEFLASQEPQEPRDFFEFFSSFTNAHGIDLLRRMLELDTAKRITVDEALAHPFLADLYDPDEAPLEVECVTLGDFDFELDELTLEQYKKLVHFECQLWNSESAYQHYLKLKETHENGFYKLLL